MAEEESQENLSSLFSTGLEIYNNVGKTDEPTNSSSVQVRIKNKI